MAGVNYENPNMYNEPPGSPSTVGPQMNTFYWYKRALVEAAKEIGKGAEEYAYHVKKLEPIPYSIDPYSCLLSSVGDKPDQTRSEGFIPSEGLE